MSELNRREFLAGVTAGSAASVASAQSETEVRIRSASTAGAPSGETSTSRLAEPVFRPLPIGSIRPTGWLLRQLQIQVAGLSGYLDEFWPDVGQSGWFGGQAEGWERAPYWLDGVIPLAWMLEDKALQNRISHYVDYIITHQRADGWYRPYPEDPVAKRYGNVGSDRIY